MVSPYISTVSGNQQNVSLAQQIEQSVQNHVNMACKYERIQLVLYITKRIWGELPDDFAIAVHMLPYDQLLDVLDKVLDAKTLDEVIEALN